MFLHGTFHPFVAFYPLFCDLLGLPVDVQFGKGNINDKVFLPAHLDNTVGLRKKILNLDMSYMNLEFRRMMRRSVVRVNMKIRQQDFKRKRGPKFKFDEEIYKIRMVIERTNAWIKDFRRLRMRREYHFAMFKAFVYLCVIIILIRYP